MLFSPGVSSIKRQVLELTAVDQKPGFSLPADLSADRPAERRGLSRDQVRLLVIDRYADTVAHTRFDRISEFLAPGDLLVFNSSRTLPATLIGKARDLALAIEVRLAELLPDGTWLALLRPVSPEKIEDVLAHGLILDFERDLSCEVLNRDQRIRRLWRLRFSKSGMDFLDLLYRIGQPIRYRYLSAAWPLNYYQNVYALQPGASEMASAGRAFSWKLLLRLRGQGVGSTSITLHTGLSSYLDNELDRQHLASEEVYWVGEEAANTIRRTRDSGGRVIAVGTTVVRALESTAAGFGGEIRPCHRYTKLRITAGYPLQIVKGLLTGLHEPEASHLDLLAAFVQPETIYAAYNEAVQRRYLWHKFGDLNLIL